MTLEVYNQATLLKEEFEALEYVIENIDTLSEAETLKLIARFPKVHERMICIAPGNVAEFRSLLHDQWEECVGEFEAL